MAASGESASGIADADLVVVNTCSVTSASDQGARQIVRKIAKENPNARIIVTGCYATRRRTKSPRFPEGPDRSQRSQDGFAGEIGPIRQGASAMGRAPVARRSRRVWPAARPSRLCSDRMRREMLLLHHSDDAGPGPQQAASRGSVGDRARASPASARLR